MFVLSHSSIILAQGPHTRFSKFRCQCRFGDGWSLPSMAWFWGISSVINYKCWGGYVAHNGPVKNRQFAHSAYNLCVPQAIRPYNGQRWTYFKRESITVTAVCANPHVFFIKSCKSSIENLLITFVCSGCADRSHQRRWCSGQCQWGITKSQGQSSFPASFITH